jgi:ABC-2 type transport system ATP-binding protein
LSKPFSGKTTTIKTLQAMLPPTSGNALISGESVTKPTERLYQLLGVVAQFDQLFLSATPRQHLELFAMLKTGNTDCVEPLLKLVSIMEHANKRVSALSGGNRRKVSIDDGNETYGACRDGSQSR